MSERRYRKVSVQIWGDAKFSSMSAEGQLAFMFVLTHPNMTPLGAMRATIAGLCAELPNVSSKGFMEPFQNGLLKASETAPLITLPNYVKHNPPENPNVIKYWLKVVEVLPECDLLTEHLSTVVSSLYEHNERYAQQFAKGLPKPFRKGLLNGMANREQEQEQEREQEREGECEGESAPEPDADSGSTACAVSPDSGEPIPISMPLKDGGTYRVGPDKLSEWQAAYPTLDVPAELRAACQWARDNPARRKTRTGAAKFLNGWLKRERDGPPGTAEPRNGNVKDMAVKQEWAEDDPFRPD